MTHTFGLAASELLTVWEVGCPQSLVDKALTILSVACPEMSIDSLSELSIGERDLRLLEVRIRSFGSRIDAFSECPACAEPLEYSINALDINALDMSGTPAMSETSHIQQARIGDYYIDFRLPNSLDLATISNCVDASSARDLLIQRCVISAQQTEIDHDEELATSGVTVDALPEQINQLLGEEMANRDRYADMQFNMICPACEQAWQITFDILGFFWAEISAEARRILREIHALAYAYGWSELDILAMTPIRRQFYLDLVTVVS